MAGGAEGRVNMLSQYVSPIERRRGGGGEERNPRENFVATRSNVAAE